MMWLIPPLLAMLGGALIPAFRTRSGRNSWTLGVTLASAICAALFSALIPDRSMILCSVTPVFSVAFRLDETGRVFLLLICCLWPLATLYALEYMAHEQREGTFFTFYTLSFGITQLLVLSANLFTLYLFYECLTLITLPLVTHHEDRESLTAGMTYLKFSVGGAALGLIGVIALGFFGAGGAFSPGGSLSPERVAGYETLLRAIFLVSFIGFGAKAAVFPLSVWLPRVSVAPTPVTALLHAVAVVNAGAFAVVRLIYDCFGTGLLAGSWAQEAALYISAFTVAMGAVMAVREHHLKRRLAWSTVSNLSYMLFSAALMTAGGHTGALTHLVFHGIMKITLFDCAGAILVQSGREYLEDLRGLWRQMPFTVAVFTLAGLALTGVPPLPGFFSKWQILSAAIAAGSPGAWAGAGALLLSSVLCAVYLISPAVQMLFLSPTDRKPVQELTGKASGRLDPGLPMKTTLGLLAGIILLSGFLFSGFTAFLSAVSAVY